MLNLDITACKLRTLGIKECDGAEITNIHIIQLRLVENSCLMYSKLYRDAVINNSSFITHTFLIFKASQCEFIAMLAHVVSLQVEIKLLRVIVGTNLAKFDLHAGPVPVV